MRATRTQRPSAHESAKSKAAEKLDGGEKRIGCYVPTRIYSAMRVKLAERAITQRQYLEELLAKDGVK